MAERWAALRFALATLRALCESEATMPRLSTLGRIAGEAGARTLVPTALDLILQGARSGPVSLGEPFWPASPRYDAVPPAGRPAQWFLAAAAEQLEIMRGYSSAFAAPTPALNWLTTSGFASPEMLRRRGLAALRAGQSAETPGALLDERPDNVNAALWRDGTVTALGGAPSSAA
jgi:hypothetical protein